MYSSDRHRSLTYKNGCLSIFLYSHTCILAYSFCYHPCISTGAYGLSFSTLLHSPFPVPLGHFFLALSQISPYFIVFSIDSLPPIAFHTSQWHRTSQKKKNTEIPFRVKVTVTTATHDNPATLTMSTPSLQITTAIPGGRSVPTARES